HPSCVGRLVDGVAQSIERDADVVVAVGCRHVLEGHPRPTPWFGAARFVAHVNADPSKLETPNTSDWSSASDPGRFLAAVATGLAARPVDAELLTRRRERLATAAEAKL